MDFYANFILKWPFDELDKQIRCFLTPFVYFIKNNWQFYSKKEQKGKINKRPEGKNKSMEVSRGEVIRTSAQQNL